jgi:hypothetical protein
VRRGGALMAKLQLYATWILISVIVAIAIFAWRLMQ